MITDGDAPVSTADEIASESAAAGAMVRRLAVLGLIATLVGRVIAPSLRGAGGGLDQTVDATDRFGSLVSYLFAIVGIAAAVVQLVRTARDGRLGRAYRGLALGLGIAVLLPLAPGLPGQLAARPLVLVATASAMLAVLAGRAALVTARTRALGAVLCCAGVAAALHLAALLVAHHAWEGNLYRAAGAARCLATAAMMADGLGLLVATSWLATRRRAMVSLPVLAAAAVALLVVWGAVRGGGEGATFWQVVAHRGLERMLPPPTPLVRPVVRYLPEALSLALAVVAVGVRGQIPAITGALALVLVARPATDVPLAALAVSVASLTAGLAARDDRALWDVLLDEERAAGSVGAAAGAGRRG
jgi:hypothetical protein